MTGKDYPHLCETCRKRIDDAAAMFDGAEALGLSEDLPGSEDPEAPIMYVYDSGGYCGGRECTSKTDRDKDSGECACVLCGYISAAEDQFHTHVHGVGNVCKGCRDEYPLACARPGCTGPIYLSFVTCETGGSTTGHFSCMNDRCSVVTHANFEPCDPRYSAAPAA
jgi:hypothetical protein